MPGPPSAGPHAHPLQGQLHLPCRTRRGRSPLSSLRWAPRPTHTAPLTPGVTAAHWTESLWLSRVQSSGPFPELGFPSGLCLSPSGDPGHITSLPRGPQFPSCRRNVGKNKGREGPVPAWGGAVASAGLRGRFLGEHPGCEGVGLAPTQPPKHSPEAFDPRGVHV